MKTNKFKKILFLNLILIVPEIAHATDYVVCGIDKKFPLVFAELTSTFMTLIKIAVPILLVISGMITFLKVTFSSNVEEDLKKAKTKLINSIIAAAVIFFAISIVNFAVSLVAGKNNKFMSCINCFINSDECTHIDDAGQKICPGFINDGEKFDDNCNIIKDTPEPAQSQTVTIPQEQTTEQTETKNTTNNVTISPNKGVVNLSCNVDTISINELLSKIETLKNNSKCELDINQSNINYTHITLTEKDTNNSCLQNINFMKNIGAILANCKQHTVEKKDGVVFIDGILIVNKTYALPETYAPNNLTDVNYDCVEERCFTPSTWNAYKEMYQAAQQEKGFDLSLISGYRPYANQEKIYNNYVNEDGKEQADTYSARPGHSEHQTGLAFDILNASDIFNQTPEAKWLNENAYKYGFILRYPQGKQQITGYKYESWHYRYVGKDLAQKLYNEGNWITLEEYLDIDSKY